jgi:predicted ArsR family transcriptional regulator
MRQALADQIAGIAMLQDPVRRALFMYVGAAAAPVGREQAAKAVHTTRENAAFHLDRLEDAGLLEVSFRRLGGKSGPGAGRPAKLYRRSRRALEVTLPPRRYELAATLFADALAARGGEPLRRTAGAAARRFGSALGRQARTKPPLHSSRASPLRAVTKVLDENGYEPIVGPRDCIRLRNCPFQALVADHRDLMCRTNLALIKGVLAGLGADRIEAQLSPQAGMCCVTIRPL